MTNDIKEQELYDFDAPFLSIVPMGANKKKFFLLKENGGMAMDLTNEMLVKLQEIFKSTLPKENEIDEITKGLSEQDKTAVKAALKVLNMYKEVLGADVLKKINALMEYGYPEPNEKYPYKKPEKMGAKEEEEEMKAVQKYMLALTKEEKHEPINKFFESILKEEDEKPAEDPKIVALMKEKEEMQKKYEEELGKRIDKEFEEQAGTFLNIPIKKEELKELLKSTKKNLKEDEYGKLINLLKASDEQIKEGNLLKEIGTANHLKGSAWAKVEKMATDLVKEKPELNMAKARTEIIKKNPKLYEEYEKERS